MAELTCVQSRTLFDSLISSKIMKLLFLLLLLMRLKMVMTMTATTIVMSVMKSYLLLCDVWDSLSGL